LGRLREVDVVAIWMTKLNDLAECSRFSFPKIDSLLREESFRLLDIGNHDRHGRSRCGPYIQKYVTSVSLSPNNPTAP